MNALTFQIRLRRAMVDKQVSARALGKMLNPDKPESGRRTVQKYLAPEAPDAPRRARRKQIATLLGLPESAFDDEEESDLVAALTLALELAKRQYDRVIA